MTRPKILHLITGLGTGGAEESLLKILPNLEDRFENRVCCIRGRGPTAQKLQKAGIPVSFLDLRNPGDLRILFRFQKIVQEFHPSLLVTYLIHADIFGRIMGRCFGIPKILSSRRGFYKNWKSLSWFDRMTAPLADSFFVQTEYARQVLHTEFKIPKEKINVIPNAVDTERFSGSEIYRTDMLREALRIPKHHIVIICVATLKTGKGYPELFSVFEKLFLKNPSLTLVVVGDGPERSTYHHQIEKFQSRPQILFLGERSDIPELLAMSDIFLLPTHSEGMSNALLEAMSSSLPVITTDIEVNREVIEENVSGLLVPVKNEDALEKAARLLIDDPKKNASREVGERESSQFFLAFKGNRTSQNSL
ncbi:MAG: glycosyltransferase [Candidatus Moraniibacteriota bacterium]|nr:MAG: glycosyltransferase [Candidatus Moranbacteria bacterium]